MSDSKKIKRKLARQKILTAALMLIESFSAFIWRVLFWYLLFIGLWLMEIPSILGPAGEIAALFVFIFGLAYFIFKDARHLSWPRKTEILRRIERANDLKHRPFSTQNDRLANPRKQKTRTLWQERGASIFAGIKSLRRPKLHRFMAAKDPYALRLLAVLIAFSGLFIAAGQWDIRLKNALNPFTMIGPQEKQQRVTLWVTPPAYTGRAITVTGKTDEPIEILQGSDIKLTVQGGWGTPILETPDEEWQIEEIAPGQHALEIPAPAAETMRVTQMNFPLATWNTYFIPDNPPAITHANTAEILPDGSMRFPLTVEDDYGVKKLTLHMDLDPVVAGNPLGTKLEETRPVYSPPKTAFEIQPVFDLTSHPWAGLPVTISFEVSDDIGQTAKLKTVAMNLPERPFHNPVARKLVEMRKRLIWNPLEPQTEMVAELEEILSYPDLFRGDTVVFLALRSASSRLVYTLPYKDARIEAAYSIIDLLWDTALRVEDGNLSLAARNLREKQTDLQKLFDAPEAAQEDIAEAMQELREALAQYLSELQQELQKRLSESGAPLMMSPEALASMISPEALGDFLNEMENQILAGDKNAAQDMLAQLQRLMDNMNPSLSPPLPPDIKQMSEGIGKLEELIKQQESLLSQTKEQAELQQQDNMSISTQDNKEKQEELRRALGQLMLDTDEALQTIPQPMGEAEREMSGAAGRLDENNPQAAIPHQEGAIQHLREAQQQMGEQLSQRLQQMTTMMMAGGMMPPLDPLGRPMEGRDEENGLLPGSRVEVPDESQRKRVDEILQMLRERSGQRSRPSNELEYYRRLLKRF